MSSRTPTTGLRRQEDDTAVNGTAHDRAVDVRNVSLGFQARSGYLQVLEDLSFKVRRSEVVAIVGPSGCGKSTVLNLLAGLKSPSSGTIRYDGRTLDGLNTDAAYITQKDTLLPWRTVLKNAALPLEFSALRRAERMEQARRSLAMVGLAGFEAFHPHQLSGGMRSRLSLARSLATRSSLFLLDEPFAALDALLRIKMQQLLLDVWEQEPKTVVYVTHDLEEAITVADRVIVMGRHPRGVLLDQPVEIPRPRRATDLRSADRFHELHRLLWGALKSEVDD